MAVYLHTLTFLLAAFCCCRFGEGQKYFSTATDDFYADQQKVLHDPSLSFHHQSNSFFPGGFFTPRDLETSDLPSHLQHTLPQYHQQQEEETYPPFRPSVPGPFKLPEEYVKPSTYKPQYDQLLHQQDYYPKPLKNNGGNKQGIVLSNHHKNNAGWGKEENGNQVDAHFAKRESSEEGDEHRKGRGKEVEEEDAEKRLGESGGQSGDNGVDEDLEEEYEEYEDEPEEDYDDEEEEEEPEDVPPEEPKNTKNDQFKPLDTTTQQPSTSNKPSEKPQKAPKEEDSFPRLVVSVVTSKTIVNNTVVSPERSGSTGGATEATPSGENSTDSWIVIASVQTSRSISGAHFIPSSEVNQSEEKKLLNTEKDDEATTYELKMTTPMIMSPTQKVKTSTESLIDKLDRVQSDLSSGLLTGGYKNDNIEVIKENASNPMETATQEQPTVSTKKYPQVKIKSFDASNRLSNRDKNKLNKKKTVALSTTARPLIKNNLDNILDKSKPVDISAFLPPGYKPPTTTEPPPFTPEPTEKPLKSILSKAKPVDDISALLPPGYKPPKEDKPAVDISALLPPGYNPKKVLEKAKPVDISSLLPPGYKPPKEDTDITPSTAVKPTKNDNKGVFVKAKPVDISSLLPPGYKPPGADSGKAVGGILSKAKPVDDISALLPPGYKGFTKPKATTPSSVRLETVSENISAGLLPPGYKLRGSYSKAAEETTTPIAATTTKATSEVSSSITTTKAPVKLVFPSRPGGARKTPRPTTPRQSEDVNNKPTKPTIHKGWPSRATTEFTGWPTPSTTPISIEKLLEAARAAATSTSTESENIQTTSSTTTTTTTTTTPKPTTPGICDEDCDLEGTVKLIGSKAQWVPELLDRNTKEYQLLENSVRSELENIYNSSPILKQWYKKIRIDAFSEGSILVDYVVEFDKLPRKFNTQEIKRYFHESIAEISLQNREAKSLNESKAEKLTLGQFQLDPKYTEFIVRPKSGYYPIDGINNEDVLLPQWAIAVIVIGLASLLFVIIFGVTVLINRHRNSKKNPTPLTEDMLNDLNKSHMGGYDNYTNDDFYNMEDVWSDPPHFEEKTYSKRRNNGSSLYDNSTTNLYGSWGSQQWENNHKNNYYNAPNSHYGGSRSAYARGDTDF